MTMRPGPTMASRVMKRARQFLRGAVSFSAMVPNAPRISPRCASSRTAVAGDSIFVRWVIGVSRGTVLLDRGSALLDFLKSERRPPAEAGGPRGLDQSGGEIEDAGHAKTQRQT